MITENQDPIEGCPLCESADTHVFIVVPQVPVYCNLLWETHEDALAAARGDIELGFCRNCGYVYNIAFEPDLMQYTQAYENSLHFSPRFQAYAEGLANRLIERHNLYGKDIIELGSGQGDFLRLLCNLGGNRGLGFDPSYAPEQELDADSAQVRFIQDYYSEKYAGYQADLICCRHVLEHIQNPVQFLRVVREAIGERRDTVVFFEVPNMEITLRALAIWDIIYEHCSYFVSSSLACAFERSGFQVSGVTRGFAGQFLGLEALPGQEPGGSGTGQDDGLVQIHEQVVAFGERYRNKVRSWERDLEEMMMAGQRAVVWGAGSKGVTFLNVLGARDEIKHVVDINPRKHGMYVAGTGQEIVAPNYLRDCPPDVVIIMNPVYEHEIGRIVKDLGLQPRLICA